MAEVASQVSPSLMAEVASQVSPSLMAEVASQVSPSLMYKRYQCDRSLTVLSDFLHAGYREMDCLSSQVLHSQV